MDLLIDLSVYVENDLLYEDLSLCNVLLLSLDNIKNYSIHLVKFVDDLHIVRLNKL